MATKNAMDFTEFEQSVFGNQEYETITDGTENAPQRIARGKTATYLSALIKAKRKETRAIIIQCIGNLEDKKLKLRLLIALKKINDNSAFIKKYGKLIGMDEYDLG